MIGDSLNHKCFSKHARIVFWMFWSNKTLLHEGNQQKLAIGMKIAGQEIVLGFRTRSAFIMPLQTL